MDVGATVMDVFIPNGPGPLWEHELRYALRSLHHYAHDKIDRVFIFGWQPWWMVNTVHVPFPDPGGPCNRNTLVKLAGVVHNTDISEQFLFTHDDIFLLGPLDTKLHHLPESPHRSRVHATAFTNAIRVIGRPGVLDYERHVPVVLDKAKVRTVLSLLTVKNVAFRTAYFNMLRAESTPMVDVKLGQWTVPPDSWPCFSIAPNVGVDARFQRWVADRYPYPSPWERL